MTGLLLLPFLLGALLAGVLVLCARTRSGVTSPEQELRELVRDDGIASLMASLREEPAFVHSSRYSVLRNRVVLDLGDLELDVCCYTAPRAPIDVVHAVYYQSSVGWVVETNGREGASKVYGWLLDVRSRRRRKGSDERP
jgi:hypothetical protein